MQKTITYSGRVIKNKKITAEVHYLENQNQEMKEQIADILDGKAVKTFQDGRYSDIMREVFLLTCC